MKIRHLLLSLALLPLLMLGGCSSNAKDEQEINRVLVSITPYRPFVERLMSCDVIVDTLVPPGSTAHTYEPSIRQVGLAAAADLWFRIGEEFETRVLHSIKPKCEICIIDLRDGVELIGDPNDPDPHIWLSPRRMIGQIELMAKSLAGQFPEKAESIERQKGEIIEELEVLDLRIKTILDFAQTDTILVSHSAYGYFCEDYGLTQLSIERHGSEPGAHSTTDVIQEARNRKIRRIFVQPQHPSKGATTIARTLDAEIIEIDPFNEDYFDNMRTMAWKFAGY